MSANIAIEPSTILTPAQLAQRLQVTPSWIRQKCRSRCGNPLPHFRIGRYVRFDWLAVSDWLRKTEVAA
jgi:hypothetical protein